MENFKALGVKPEFIKGLNDLGIINPTEIQKQVIPLLLNGNTDLVGLAQTGTGKTAAFGLPLLHKIDHKKDCIQALILCPTRELGKQVAKQLFRYTKYSDKIFSESVYGGEKIDKQIANYIARACPSISYRFILPKPYTPGVSLGENGPKTAVTRPDLG
jgi:ATP-dependent RNA helicase DeaD